MPRVYLDHDPQNARYEVIENLRKNLEEEGARKQELRDAVKKAYLEGVMSGKIKPKTDGPIDIEGIVGGETLPEFEPVLNRKSQTRKTVISRGPRPYEEMRKAGETMGLTPEDLYRQGMATGVGEPILGKKSWFGLGKAKPELLLNEKGEPITGLPKYEKYQLGAPAIRQKAIASQVLKSPVVTKRSTTISDDGLGEDVDEGMDVGLEEYNFDSVEEAEAADLPSGTIVYIQGRKAVIE